MKLKSTAMIKVIPYGYSNNYIDLPVKFYYSIIIHTKTGEIFIKALSESLKRTRIRSEHLNIARKETILDIVSSIVQYETGVPNKYTQIRIKNSWSDSWISDYHIVTDACLDNREILPYLAAYVVKHKLLEDA